MASRSDIEAGRAYVSLMVKDDNFVKGLRKASQRLSDFGSGVAKIGVGISAMGTAILAPLAAAVNEFVSFGSQLVDVSNRTGIGAKALSEYAYAAEQTGASLEDVEAGARKMQKSITEAASGSKSAQETFRNLGLSVAELRKMSPDKQFETIAKKISEIPDPTKRAAAAMEIFGKSGTNLLPMMADLKGLQEEARKLGFTMSDEAAAKAENLGDALSNLGRTGKFTAISIGGALEPAVTKATKVIQRIATQAMQWIDRNSELVTTIAAVGVGALVAGTAITGLGIAIMGAGAVLSGMATVLGTIGTVLGVIVSPVGLVTAALVGGVAAWAMYTESGQNAVGAVTEAMGKILGTVKDTFGGIADAIYAGDLALAGKIAMAGLKVAFLQGVAALSTSVGGAFGEFLGTIGTQIAGGDFASAWNTAILAMSDLWATFSESMVAVFTTAMRAVAEQWDKTTSKITSWILKNAEKGGALGVLSDILLMETSRGRDASQEFKWGKELDEKRRAAGIPVEGDTAGGLADAQKNATDQIHAQANAARTKLQAMDANRQGNRRLADKALADGTKGGTAGVTAGLDTAQQELDFYRARAADLAEQMRKRDAEQQQQHDQSQADPAVMKREVFGSFSAAALSAQGVGGKITPGESKIAALIEKQIEINKKQLEKAGLLGFLH